MSIRVQSQAFDPGVELNALHAANLGIGAVVSFVGYVRDYNDGTQRVPDLLVARIGGFGGAEFFQAEAGSRDAVKVEMSR